MLHQRLYGLKVHAERAGQIESAEEQMRAALAQQEHRRMWRKLPVGRISVGLASFAPEVKLGPCLARMMAVAEVDEVIQV